MFEQISSSLKAIEKFVESMIIGCAFVKNKRAADTLGNAEINSELGLFWIRFVRAFGRVRVQFVSSLH